MQSKEYWNKKIIEWENSSYQDNPRGVGFVERFAAKFRRPIKGRREALMSLLGDKIAGKSVLELGCGSGELCFALLRKGAASVTGIDIAQAAIDAAKKKAAELGVQGKAQFFAKDIRQDMNLPGSDFVVGLGFIDYIEAASLKKLFAAIRGKFVFSFPEKKINLINILQYIYLKSQGCPSFYKFKRDNFKGYQYYTFNGMVFITNFNAG